MPDIFVPEDTAGYTSYYIESLNRGLIQQFAADFAEKYRPMLKEKKLDALVRIMPRDNTLLNSYVNFAALKGLPARWFYINRSRNILLNQIKGVIARDLIGYDAFIEILNRNDATVKIAVSKLKEGKSPISIPKGKIK